MSAIWKAIGVYVAIVAALFAWVGGSIWAINTEQSETLITLTVAAPIFLALAFYILGLVVWLPIASLHDHFKEAKK